MKCGHTANGTLNSKNGIKLDPPTPVCLVCYGINEGAEIIRIEQPSLKNRKATCIYCMRVARSDCQLAFFEYTPNIPYDKYYCGCKGWD